MHGQRGERVGVQPGCVHGQRGERVGVQPGCVQPGSLVGPVVHACVREKRGGGWGRGRELCWPHVIAVSAGRWPLGAGVVVLLLSPHLTSPHLSWPGL